MATSIGEAVLTIGLDDSAVTKGMAGIGASLKKHSRAIGLGMTAVGGSIMAIGVTSVKAFADMGDEVHKMSLRTGIATESLSRLKYASELGGSSLGAVEKGIKRMASTLQDARDGLSTSVDAMDALGLSAEEFDGLNPEEAFMKLAGAVAGIEDPLIRSALAQDVFGKAGTEMLPMLSEGTEGLRNMMKQAEKFGVIMDKDAAEAAAKLTDQMTQLKGGFQKIQASIAENLIPVLIPLIDKIRDAISKVSAWMKENPGLTKTIIIVASAIGGLLAVLGPIVIMLPGIIAALPLLGAAFAVLTGPVGLIIAAIVGLIAIGVLLVKHWDSIKLFFIGLWATIVDIFKKHWDKILLILFPAAGIVVMIIRNWGAIVGFFKNMWASVKDIFFSNINAIIRQINKLIDIINIIPSVNIGQIGEVGGKVKGYAQGGMITEPTLLSSLRTGKPYGIAGEAGPERIVPGGGQTITNNFQIAQLVVREDADVPRIARELYVMQQQRARGAGA